MAPINKPTTTGEWTRDTSARRKTYRHVSGVAVQYLCNEWLWEIVGGKHDGVRLKALWAAQAHALLDI